MPPELGQLECYDYQYERNGVANMFIFFEPLQSWIHIEVTDHRKAVDFAQMMKYLVDERHPTAEKIGIVLDQLNTHSPASLYKTFDPKEAKRIADKLKFYYTPKHGSWLNMAEIELSVLNRQCLNCRIPDQDALKLEIAAWEQERNQNLTLLIGNLRLMMLVLNSSDSIPQYNLDDLLHPYPVFGGHFKQKAFLLKLLC